MALEMRRYVKKYPARAAEQVAIDVGGVLSDKQGGVPGRTDYLPGSHAWCIHVHPHVEAPHRQVAEGGVSSKPARQVPPLGAPFLRVPGECHKAK